MRGIFLLLAGAITSLGVHAQAPIPVPQLVAGDRWVYDRYGFTDRLSARVEFSVEKTDPSSGLYGEKETVLEAFGSDSGPKGGQQERQRVVATLTSPIPNTKSGHVSLLEFPLEVGKVWQYETTFTPSSGYDQILKGTAKVLGWEEVQVPAGKFRALKVEHDATVKAVTGPHSAQRKMLIWYVPEVKRWVRFEFTQTSNRQDSTNRFRLELVSSQTK